MNSQITAYVTLICTSGIFNLYLCFYAFTKRHLYTNIANYFILYTAATTIYCFGSAFGLVAGTIEEIKFWTAFLYVGMPFSPPLGLLFVCKYLGIRVRKRVSGILLTIPSITLLLVATNDWHHLHYRVYELDPVLGAPYVHLEIGVWYVVHGLMTFGCMLAAFLFILSRWKETSKSYRPQLISLMCGQFIPIATAFVYLLGLTPPGVDPVPMILWLSSLLYLVAINSSRMFSIVPIAKDAIFNSIDDGVIVLDESNRIIEFNQMGKGMFPSLNKSMLGTDFDKLWFELSGESLPLRLETDSFTWEHQAAADSAKRVYQVRTSPLLNANERQGLLIIFTDVTELQRLQAQLEHLAYYDELTQIYNRRAFFQQSEQELAAAKESQTPYTLLLFDIDHFKKVNDTFGHQVGDQLLLHVAEVCRSELEEDMLFARYGGEEFVIALTEREAAEGEALANRLRRQVEERPLHTAEGDISVTLSSGVAEAGDGKGETLGQLLNKADQALYEAKRGGRNQVRVYAGE